MGADGVHSTVRKLLEIPFEGYDLPKPISFVEVRVNPPEPYKSGFLLSQNNTGMGVILYHGNCTIYN